MKLWIKSGWSVACTVLHILEETKQVNYELAKHLADINPQHQYTIEQPFGLIEADIYPQPWILNDYWYMGANYTVADLQKLIDRNITWKAES